MSRRKLNQRNIRKITKLAGKSYGIIIPIEFIRELNWREKQKVTVKKTRDRIIIEDWSK